MKIHFLQSDIWKNFLSDLGRSTVEGSGDGWSYIGMIEKDRIGKYIYVPYGPHAENITSMQDAVSDITKKAKKLGAYVVYIEPTDFITPDEAERIFKHRGKHRQAHRTLRIDLNRDEDSILADMNKTRRKQYRNYPKKGITIEKSNTKETLDEFYKLLRVSSHEKGFYVRDKSFFESLFKKLVPDHASLFVAKQDGETEVIALVYDDNDTRYYAHVGRNLNDNSLQATSPLITYMIMDAKNSGKKFFDLYGISESDDKIDEKSGFTVFKKTFGGEVVQYGGAWEIPIKKASYYSKKALSLSKKLIKR